jgi:hypothetical protein
MSASKPGFRALGERIAREEDEILARPLAPEEAVWRPEARAENRARAFRLWFGEPRRATSIGVALAASFVVVLLAGAVIFARTRPLGVVLTPATAASGGWISAPSDAPVSLRFSEGTEVSLEPEAHARVAEVTRRGAHLLIESGTARVSVTPNRGGQWTFTAGPFQVDVKGTRFEVGWDPRAQIFTLKLTEGRVFISGCALGGGRPLFAGETIRASCLTNDFHIDGASPSGSAASAREPEAASPLSPPEAPPALAPASGLDPDESATRPPSTATARPSAGRGAHAGEAGESTDGTWQSLAQASRFKEAFARVNERGFESELAHASRDDLLLLGDVARLSGDSGRALLAYERVRSRAPGTEAAANAAFAMGRVCFDQRAAYAEAAAWFAVYRAERSNGRLARDATGRQMEALARAGDATGAARVAEEYLRRYPKGPHAPLARTLRPEAN